jgi:hypothetical protein
MCDCDHCNMTEEHSDYLADLAAASTGDTPSEPPRLYAKYRVERTDGRSAEGEKHHGCKYFVLDVDHDPHALAALEAYEKSLRAVGANPKLAKDIQAMRHARTLHDWDSFVGDPR